MTIITNFNKDFYDSSQVAFSDYLIDPSKIYTTATYSTPTSSITLKNIEECKSTIGYVNKYEYSSYCDIIPTYSEYKTEFLGNFISGTSSTCYIPKNSTLKYLSRMYYDDSYDNDYTGLFYNPTSSIRIENYEKIEKKNKLKSQLHIIVKSRAPEYGHLSDAEWMAMKSLRDMVSEADFRKYIKYGFILVKGASGKIYQVFRNRMHTKVYLKGVLVEEVCVRIRDTSIPPTDNVIAFKTIIETDEDSFKKMGNLYKMKKAA